ncbi:ExbD/TolR family protein [Aurantiacibacter luteus]|uniref:ExbD/TolR family protein n=1 Tax=Aurantiacibacter luteus TaxID=1581420 RepID=UPI00069B395B|nr:biopolymer transporter ExbD [Aurantiacibacter luteus]
MPRPLATPVYDHGQPIRRLSAAPIASVVLIVAAMTAMTYPMQTHAVTIDLPLLQDDTLAPLTPVGNRLSIDSAGEVTWNAEPVDERQLRAILEQTSTLDEQPALWFEPEGDAAYGRVAQVLAIVESLGLADNCFHFANAAGFRPVEGPTTTIRVTPGHRECDRYR